MTKPETIRRPIGNDEEPTLIDFLHKNKRICWLENKSGGYHLSVTSEGYALRRKRGTHLLRGVPVTNWQDMQTYAFLSHALEDLSERAKRTPYMDIKTWFYAELHWPNDNVHTK